MRINRSNYEAYLLDLSEGNLSDELLYELNSFLASNPDLDTDLIDDFPILEDEITEHIDKELLTFDSITPANRKHFFIAYHEGDLDTSGQNKVTDFISKNPEFNLEFNQFSKLSLKPSVAIFKEKESLHSIANSDKSKGLFYWSPRIAAILIIGFILNALLQNTINISPKYTFENNRPDLRPVIQKEGTFDVSNFLVNKNTEEQNSNMSFVVNNKTENEFDKNKVTDSTKSDDNNRKNHFNNISERRENAILKKNPELNQVIASLNNKEDENKELKTQPNKKMKTPPSLLAFLGEKAKEKELLSDNGRPNILSLINKGSKSLTGQEVIAQTKTEQSTSTIFQLGSFKIERINKK